MFSRHSQDLVKRVIQLEEQLAELTRAVEDLQTCTSKMIEDRQATTDLIIKLIQNYQNVDGPLAVQQDPVTDFGYHW